MNPPINKKILLAIENTQILKQLEEIFSASTYSLSKISTCEELEALINSPFDLFICEEKFIEICHRVFPNTYCLFFTNTMIEELPENFIQLLLPVENKFLKQLTDILIKNRQLSEQLNQTASILNSHQNLSSQIQRTMLFREPPSDVQGCDLASVIEVSQEVDSDFLDFFRPLPHIVDMVMGDVMGKGIGSSLVGIATKLQINHISNQHSFPLTYTRFDGWQEEVPSLHHIIEKTHKALVPLLMEIEHFVCLLYGRFNLRTRQFSYIDCGFTNPLIFRKKKNKAERITSTHFPLGVVKNYDYKEQNIYFDENDIFLFFSDGVLDMPSPTGEFFGEQRLRNLLELHAEKSPAEILQSIQKAIHDFSGKSAISNDITFFAIKFSNLDGYKPSANKPTKFNSVISQLNAVRQLVKEYCLKAPGNHTLLATELELVVDEVFSNIVKHSYKNTPGGSILIQVEYQKEGLIIELSDQGEAFNPSEIPHPSLFGDNETGYGWFLIRHLVDHITYLPKASGNGWNKLRLYKKYFNKEAQMELTHIQKNDKLVITLEGENLDSRSILEFKDKIAHLLTTKGSANIIFDLSQIKFIDSSGLGAFLSIFRQLNTKGGQLKLAGLTPPVKSIFELVSMHKIFDCYQTVEEALQSFKTEG